jgi:hypothetical protein
MKKYFLILTLCFMACFTVFTSCATPGAFGTADGGEYAPAENPFAGEWREGECTLSFNADGTFRLFRDGRNPEEGAYLVRGNVLITLEKNSELPVRRTFEVTDSNTIEVNRAGVPAVYRRIINENAGGPSAGDAEGRAFFSRNDEFSGKNWNAPHKNNMHDRWEFRRDGTFHFRHIHHGRPLDRGDYSYLVQDDVLVILKEDLKTLAVYTVVFRDGKSFTVTPVEPPGGKPVPYTLDASGRR